MRCLLLEMTAEEMRANKRLADDIADALSYMVDNIVRVKSRADLEDDIQEGEEDAVSG